MVVITNLSLQQFIVTPVYFIPVPLVKNHSWADEFDVSNGHYFGLCQPEVETCSGLSGLVRVRAQSSQDIRAWIGPNVQLKWKWAVFKAYSYTCFAPDVFRIEIAFSTSEKQCIGHEIRSLFPTDLNSQWDGTSICFGCNSGLNWPAFEHRVRVGIKISHSGQNENPQVLVSQNYNQKEAKFFVCSNLSGEIRIWNSSVSDQCGAYQVHASSFENTRLVPYTRSDITLTHNAPLQ